MKILKLKSFSRWAKSERLTDTQLINAVMEIERGLVDGILGSGLLKKRIARQCFGKRSGFRTLLAYRNADLAIFIFGFAKNECENIDDDQLDKLKQLAKHYLGLSEEHLNRLILTSKLLEVNYHGS